jgi:pectate lyase
MTMKARSLVPVFVCVVGSALLACSTADPATHSAPPPDDAAVDSGQPDSAKPKADATPGVDATPDAPAAGGNACDSKIEGFAFDTPGGSQGDVFRVVSLADSGPGTLREAIESRTGPRRVVFDVAGTITIASVLVIKLPFLTIDGCSAPTPGITIQTASEDQAGIAIAGTHDIVIRNLRVVGQWDPGEPAIEGTGLVTVDGDAKPDFHARKIVLDHLTIERANDLAFGVWGTCSDLVFSWILTAWSRKASTTSYHSGPAQTLRRVAYHHNLFAKTIERNPQVRNDIGELYDFLFVNNIVFEWGFSEPASGYGTRFGRENESPISGAFLGNLYASSTAPENAFIRLGPQGQQFFDDNSLPPEATAPTSTTNEPFAVPPGAEITRSPAFELAATVLPWVGVRDRNDAEQALVDEVAAKISP